MKTTIVNWVISLLLLVIGALALFSVYQSFYKPMSEENEKLRSDILILEASLKNQKEYGEQKDFYISEAERLNAEATDTLDEFPMDLWEEDHIAFADYITNQTGMSITSLNWGTDSAVKMLTNGMELHAETLTFNYSRSYATLKDLITFLVNDAKNHTSLTTLSISYNSQQDTISGTMYVQRYYLAGQQGTHTPAKPEGDIEIGQDNVLD